MAWLPVFGIFMCAKMSMQAIAHGGCMDTVREFALEFDSRRKIPYCTGDSNPCQYRAWLFSQTLYQLSYPCPTYAHVNVVNGYKKNAT